MDYSTLRSRDLPRHDNHHDWDPCHPLCTALHSHPALSFQNTPTLRLQHACNAPDMFRKPRARYDPETFYPQSPDRASREGKELLDTMEALRESIRDTTANKMQKAPSSNLQVPKLQGLGRMNSRSNFHAQRRSTAQPVGLPWKLQDGDKPPASSKPSEDSQPISLSSQKRAKREVRPEDFEELIKHLHDLNLNISQLQLLIDREVELWDLHPDRVPSYLDALHRVIEEHGKPRPKPEERPDELSKKAAIFGDSDGRELPIFSNDRRPIKQRMSEAHAHSFAELEGHLAVERPLEDLEVIAGSSRLGLPRDASSPLEEHDASGSRAGLLAVPEIPPRLDTGLKRRAVALPPRPVRLSSPSSVLKSANGFKSANLKSERMDEKEVISSVRHDDIENLIDASDRQDGVEKWFDAVTGQDDFEKEVVDAFALDVNNPSSGGAGSSMVHYTSPDGHFYQQAKAPKRLSLGHFKEKLARSLSSMAQSLRDGQSSGKRTSTLATLGSTSSLNLHGDNARPADSKREGKRRRQVRFADDLLVVPLPPQSDTDVAATISEQANTAQQPRHDLPEEPSTECICCGDEKSTLKDFPAHPPTYACEHPVQTCKKCMETWLASELAEKGCKSLHCPECRKEMEYEDVRRGANKETREEYDKRLFLMALSEEPEFAWCLVCSIDF